MIIVTLPFSKCFLSTLKRKTTNSSGLKCVFEKHCFRDGLVGTIGITVEIKLSFEILRRLMWMGRKHVSREMAMLVTAYGSLR